MSGSGKLGVFHEHLSQRFCFGLQRRNLALEGLAVEFRYPSSPERRSLDQDLQGVLPRLSPVAMGKSPREHASLVGINKR